MHVVRCFDDDNIIRADCSTDPASDIATVNLELIFADMETVQKRRDKAQRARNGGDKKATTECELAERMLAHLEQEKPARTLPVSEEEQEILNSWFLLTTKPVIYAANIAEEDLGKDISEVKDLDKVKAIADAEGAEMLVISAAIE